LTVKYKFIQQKYVCKEFREPIPAESLLFKTCVNSSQIDDFNQISSSITVIIASMEKFSKLVQGLKTEKVSTRLDKSV